VQNCSKTVLKLFKKGSKTVITTTRTQCNTGVTGLGLPISTGQINYSGTEVVLKLIAII